MGRCGQRVGTPPPWSLHLAARPAPSLAYANHTLYSFALGVGGRDLYEGMQRAVVMFEGAPRAWRALMAHKKGLITQRSRRRQHALAAARRRARAADARHPNAIAATNPCSIWPSTLTWHRSTHCHRVRLGHRPARGHAWRHSRPGLGVLLPALQVSQSLQFRLNSWLLRVAGALSTRPY